VSVRHTLLGKLEGADPNDNSLFKALVLEVMTTCDLSCADISRMFGCSVSTIRKWISGIAAPHPVMRKTVFDALANVVATRGAVLVRSAGEEGK
jgi:hypothetical protein